MCISLFPLKKCYLCKTCEVFIFLLFVLWSFFLPSFHNRHHHQRKVLRKIIAADTPLVLVTIPKRKKERLSLCSGVAQLIYFLRQRRRKKFACGYFSSKRRENLLGSFIILLLVWIKKGVASFHDKGSKIFLFREFSFRITLHCHPFLVLEKNTKV